MALSMTATIPVEPTMNMKLVHRPQPPSKGQAAPMHVQPSFRFQNLRLDPSRALEPARKKLTTVEAQRVMSVFDETIRRLEIVTLLQFIMQNIDRFGVSLGGELVELLKHHSVIISSYDDIRQELDIQLDRRAAMQKSPDAIDDAEKEMGGTDEVDEEPRQSSAYSARSAHSTNSQLEATMRNLSLVAQQLSHSTRNVLRAFSLNPAIMTVIQAEMSQRGSECKALLQFLHELKEILMHKLLTTPEEERERIAYLKEISKRERQSAVIIEKLEADLKEKNDDKEEEIRKKNNVIKKLQNELHQIEKFSEEHIRRIRADAEKQESADAKNSDGKRQKLQTEVGQLRSQLQNATMEHRESESELRRKKYKIETEVENWIQRYDQELGERQDEYEEIDAVYTEEKKQLHELEERFNTLEKEYVGIMQERRLAREKREKAERELAMMVKASTTIQAFWRSYKVRKALKQRKKKGGKKAGKKKGKK
eukprot:GHVL01004613.1.p1 GENE.GHVL01004613.1~~GHVL01004613.1.p1  ORF type:complete len:481 (-),score=59.73 GHVL01004613.1:229-1671(-)